MTRYRSAIHALLLLLAGPLMADPTLVARFDEPGAAENWQVFTDRVMGGVSTGRAVIEDGALTLTGDVSTANNGGFVQARLRPVSLDADARRLVIRARGDGQVYYIHLRTRATVLPWHYYQLGFTAPERWTEIALPLEDFRPSHRVLPDRAEADAVTSVALVAFGRDHRARVSLSGIRAE